MPFIVIETSELLKTGMITGARARYLEATGHDWLAVDLDPQVLSFGVVADAINRKEQEWNESGIKALPGPESTHLDEWVATSGIRRNTGESNQQLWERYLDFRASGDETTEPGLTRIAKNNQSVLDIGFRVNTATDLSVDVYLVSNESIDGQLPGTPSIALNTAISVALNAIDVKVITDQFNVRHPTVIGFRIEATIHYNPEIQNLASFQAAVEEALLKYAADVRSFSIKKPCKGSALDNGELDRVLYGLKDVRRVSAHGFRRATDVSLQTYIDGIDNGFFSCENVVNIDPDAPVANQINLTFVSA